MSINPIKSRSTKILSQHRFIYGAPFASVVIKGKLTIGAAKATVAEAKIASSEKRMVDSVNDAGGLRERLGGMNRKDTSGALSFKVCRITIFHGFLPYQESPCRSYSNVQFLGRA